jgi:peroxiredoxin
MIDPYTLPDHLPRPVDDGAADHLAGTGLPRVELTASDGSTVSLRELAGLTIVYAYPRTGRPGEPSLSEDWDQIPGARGCTPEACSFRDHHANLLTAGASAVYGLSTQDSGYQRELVERLHLPFPILSDAALELADALTLPTFEAAGQTLLKRLTLAVRDGRVVRVWYPVFPPDAHAAEVLAALRSGL